MMMNARLLKELLRNEELRQKTQRIVKFGLVGASGVAVNMFFLWLFTKVAGLHYLASSAAAIELSILNNFLWNNLWTFSDRRGTEGDGAVAKLIKYHLSVSVAALTNVFLLWLLHGVIGINYLLANGIGIGVGFALNYGISNRWVFR